MEALSQLKLFIKQHALFHEGESVLLAVSGGRDSVLMAHLFKAADYRFGIAHCNFNLRAEESEQDEKFSEGLAEELTAPFYTSRFDTNEYALENHISIQMAARELRYTWLEKIRNEFNYQYIAVAHHQNDVIETMLLNLTRGTGISGLHGILPKKGKIIRPLLFLNRDEIDELVQQNAYTYREDSSNLSAKYSRNKLRLEVIPVLKELNPALEQTFEANRRRFAELEVLLDLHIQEIKKRLFKQLTQDEFEISIAELKKLNPLNTLLYGLFHPYGFTESVLNDLSHSWDGNPGKVFRSAGHQLLIDRGHIILSPIKESEHEDILLEPDAAIYTWDKQKFGSKTVPISRFVLNRNENIAQLDFDLLSFPLKLRSWKNGDFFQPLGLKRKKKLSDLFVDRKISLNHKKDIAILENNNGDILWVAGLRIDERYKISPNTKKVFILEQFM
jgi:tRNA(Ile)-lysidine synthase